MKNRIVIKSYILENAQYWASHANSYKLPG